MERKFTLVSIISLLITLLLTSSVFADDKIYTNDTLKFKINSDNTITIVEYYGNDASVKVPMTIGPYIVTTIADGAFKDSGVKSVELPSTITTISSDAFDNISSVSIKYFNEENKIIEIEDPVEYRQKEEPQKQDEQNKQEEAKSEETAKQNDDVDESHKDNDKTHDNVDEPQDVINEEGFSDIEVSVDELLDDDETPIQENETENSVGNSVGIDGSQNQELNQGTITLTNVEINPIGYVVGGGVLIAIVILLIIKRKKA